MAVNQRLTAPSPSREIKVPINYDWQRPYQAALLETDWTEMQVRIQTAESEIRKRRLLLSQDHGGTLEEREALVNAMGVLSVRRMDAVSWLERQAGTSKKPASLSQNSTAWSPNAPAALRAAAGRD